MRAIRVASAALLGVTALTLCAPAALASDGGDGDGEDHYVMSEGYSVLPGTVAAGGQVTLGVDREVSGCKGAVTVSSAVFDAVTVRRGATSAVATVDRDAEPGAVYRVTFDCGGLSAVKELTVAAGGPGDPTPAPYPAAHGVHAGEGGSVAGFDLREIALGAVLIAGALGTAYHCSRRRGSGDAAT